jgi:3-deoxy-manno-octulosonate cytidylyltransferase (CMP-KDO synthetase)
MIEWVWRAATATNAFSSVVIAIDDPETARTIDTFGGTHIMTSHDCRSGTLRLSELLLRGAIDGDLFVNWQGDEPLISAAMIGDLLRPSSADVRTLKKEITSPEEIASPHVVKVVTDHKGRALYFSRSPIPFRRDACTTPIFKHIGLYAYTKAALAKIAILAPSSLELAENLEQLSFLDGGLSIDVFSTLGESHGVDIADHLEAVSTLLEQRNRKSLEAHRSTAPV